MTTSCRPNGAGWNAGRAVGQKTAFTLKQTQQLSEYFIEQGRWHDLAMLSLGIDSFLRAEDLLALRVRDVCYSNGSIRDLIAKKQQKTQHGVFPALTVVTQTNLAHWIQVSGKIPQNFLFTRSKPADKPAIGRYRYGSVVKQWALWLGLPSENYSTHSIRRTKPVHLFWEAERQGQHEQMLVILAKLLGHKSVDVTLEYLGITQQRATDATLRCHMVKSRGKKG